MKPTITVNQYPIGWEWLDRVPLEDFNWLIDIFATMTDNTDTYDFVFYEDSETLPEHPKRICSVDKIHCIYTHHRQPRTNMITSLIAGQEMTNINIFMTTTRTNTQSITKN